MDGDIQNENIALVPFVGNLVRVMFGHGLELVITNAVCSDCSIQAAFGLRVPFQLDSSDKSRGHIDGEAVGVVDLGATEFGGPVWIPIRIIHGRRHGKRFEEGKRECERERDSRSYIKSKFELKVSTRESTIELSFNSILYSVLFSIAHLVTIMNTIISDMAIICNAQHSRKKRVKKGDK
jgi:hypothetical protein